MKRLHAYKLLKQTKCLALLHRLDNDNLYLLCSTALRCSRKMNNDFISLMLNIRDTTYVFNSSSNHTQASKSKWFVGSSSKRRWGVTYRARASAIRIRQPPANMQTETFQTYLPCKEESNQPYIMTVFCLC